MEWLVGFLEETFFGLFLLCRQLALSDIVHINHLVIPQIAHQKVFPKKILHLKHETPEKKFRPIISPTPKSQ